MGQHTLRRRLSYWIMLSLALGTVITAAVSWVPIYIQYPRWIDRIVDEMISDQGKVLRDLSNLSSAVGGEIAQKPIDFLLLMRMFQDQYWDGAVSIKADFSPSENYVNGKSLALGEDTPVGYSEKSRLSYDASIWYIDTEVTEESQLSDETKQHMRDCAVFDFFGRPSVAYPNSTMVQMYHAYQSDGLMYETPARNESYYVYYESDENCEFVQPTTPHYDPRCRPWYAQVQSTPTPGLVTLTDPYLFASTDELGQTVCRGKWSGQSLQSVTCIDYTIDEELMGLFDLKNSTLMYTYVLDPDGDVFFHSKLDRSANPPKSILDLELPGCSKSELDYYKNTILPLFASGKESLSTYTRKGDKLWIYVTPIFLVLSEDGQTGFRLSIGVVLSEETLRKGFKDLIDTSDNILQVELIVFFCALVAILTLSFMLSRVIGRSVIRPINDLAEILDRMNEGDLGVNIKMNFKRIPAEIARLYDVFGKLKIVLKFSHGHLAAGCEAQALMSNAQAMKLFQEVHNLKGISVCAANTGAIHFKEGRYEEAIAYFQQAYNLAKEARDASPDAESRAHSDRVVLERERQLATAFLAISERTSKKLWDQAVELLLLMAEQYQHLGDEGRRVSTILDIAMAYIQWGNLSFAKENVMVATSRILSATDEWTIPPEILRERSMFTEGLIMHLERRDFEAASLLTSCIELNDHYDPIIRKHALKHLKDIFDAHALSHQQIDELLAEFQSSLRDIAFVMDYSSSMAGLRVHRTISNLSRLFERNIGDLDRFAFITVNRIPRTVFNLMEKGKNTAFLKAQILKANEPRGGTASYEGIKCALKQFEAFGEKEMEESELLGEIEDAQEMRSKWIVCVFDGEDNCSRVSLKQVKKQLAASHANLVVIGLLLSPEAQALYKSLCAVTPRGLFLASNSLQELDISFTAAARWIEAPAISATGSSLFQLCH